MTSTKYTLTQDRMNGNRWQVRYWDREARLWFDAGDAFDDRDAAIESLKEWRAAR